MNNTNNRLQRSILTAIKMVLVVIMVIAFIVIIENVPKTGAYFSYQKILEHRIEY